MKEKIRNILADTFLFDFDVKKQDSSYEEYVIKPKDSYKDTFIMKVKVKENTRIIIEVEPDIYGNYFLENLNSSDENKRNIFSSFWQVIGNNNISLKINDKDCSYKEFINNKEKWHKFYLRYTVAPYYDIETENRCDKILNDIVLICSMILSITNYSIEGYEEGNKTTVTSDKYERNPINRELCLKANGYKCEVCGFDFEKVYGSIGRNFIEVHHIIPLSDIGHAYVIDPIHDLVPICPNCHSMIHKRKPPFSVAELKEIINRNRK